MFQLVETNISYSIWLKVPLVLSSNPTYEFLLCVFRCTHLKSIIHWAWSRFSRHHKKKTNLKVLFALSERHPSVWGHEHWKSRTSEHINANQATLHFLAETRFLLFMLNPQTHRDEAFYGEYKENPPELEFQTGNLTLGTFPQQELTKSILNSGWTDW